MEACRNYPLRNWEHLTFEYVMLGGVNDAAEDARRVVRLLAPLTRVKVNLIPWNPGELPYKESSAETIEEFRRILTEKGVPAFVRYSRGRDVMAACGQLALKEVKGIAVHGVELRFSSCWFPDDKSCESVEVEILRLSPVNGTGVQKPDLVG